MKFIICRSSNNWLSWYEADGKNIDTCQVRVFLIYGSDIFELRKHIHVTYNHRGFKRCCKFWLEPDISLDENKTGDFNEKGLREIQILIKENLSQLIEQLDLFYNNKQVKAIRK